METSHKVCVVISGQLSSSSACVSIPFKYYERFVCPLHPSPSFSSSSVRLSNIIFSLPGCSGHMKYSEKKIPFFSPQVLQMKSFP